MQPWRKVLLVVLGGLIAAEALLQGLAFAKVLPGQNISGLFTHYGRVYQNGEGFANGRTNEHGFFYPPFELADGAKRILVAGDTYVQGLQVSPEENLGAVLDRRFAAGQPEEDIEVLAVGLPGYGPGLYLDTLLIPYVIRPLSPEEVIVFFHLADDLQTVEGPGNAVPYYTLNPDGAAEIHPDDFGLRHTLQHVIIRGFEPPNPVRTASSYSFLFNFVDELVGKMFGRQGRVPAPATNTRQADEASPFGASSFAFRVSGDEGAGLASAVPASAETAFAVATGLLKGYHDQLAAEGIRMRLVTIPYFPAGFYTAYSGPGWESRLGDYDLFLPEQALADFAAANDIPFLPMGRAMQADGLAVEEIRALFYKDGAGRFTPAGHEYFAETVYACFYGGGEGCPLN
jgi:hypothetical protein